VYRFPAGDPLPRAAHPLRELAHPLRELAVPDLKWAAPDLKWAIGEIRQVLEEKENAARNRDWVLPITGSIEAQNHSPHSDGQPTARAREAARATKRIGMPISSQDPRVA